MGNCDNFSSNIVVQAIHCICVDETVSYPYTSFDNLFNFSKHLIMREISQNIVSKTALDLTNTYKQAVKFLNPIQKC